MSDSRKKVVYVAGPFRAASAYVAGQQDSFGILTNIMAAMQVSLELWRAGLVGLCPHGNTFCFQNSAPDDVWLDGDIELMRRCDAVLMVPGWERSSGARAEKEIAENEGIPVYFSVEAAIEQLRG